MSRIGRLPIKLPEGVKAKIEGRKIVIQGRLGTLEMEIPEQIDIQMEDGFINVVRKGEDRRTRALHGLIRSLINNMVIGVSQGFEKKLEISGIGYRAEVKGNMLILNLGYSHPINYILPEGIKAMVEKGTIITIQGIDKELVGLTAAKIRSFRKPDPYKAKGIIYAGEKIIRKVGKTGAK